MIEFIKRKQHFLVLVFLLILIIIWRMFYYDSDTTWVVSFFSNPLSIAAIFISFLALMLAIYDTNKKTKHYRLSVKPFLDFDKQINYLDNRITIYLTNKGLSAAIIINFKIFYKNTVYENPSVDDVNGIVDIIFFDSVEKHTHTLHPGGVLAKDEKLEFVELKLQEMDENSDEVNNKLSLITLEIQYESIYGDKDKLKYNCGEGF